MFQSKALREFSDKKKSKFYSWWLESPLSDWYYKYSWELIGNPLFQIKRLYQWYMNVFRHDYDFDGHCLFAIIEYKLKRIQKVLLNGHAIQEPKDLKALRLAIKLAGRLKDDEYDMVQYDRHGKKWGELKTWFTPIEGSTSSRWNSSRPNAVTDEEKEQERVDHIAGMWASHARMQREEKWLYMILHKYLRNWWD